MRLDGLVLLATRRLAADRFVAALAGLLLATSVALPATGSLYADRAALAGLRSSFILAAPQDRSVRVAIDAPITEVDANDGQVAADVGRSVAPMAGGVLHGGVLRVLHSVGFLIDGAVAGSPAAESAAAGDLMVLAAFDDVAAHARITDGGWPAPGASPPETAVSAPAAAALGLRTGDIVRLRDPQGVARTLAVRISGTWQADGSDPYWENEALDTAGSETARLTRRGPFLLDRADFEAAVAGTSVHAEWRAFPDPATLDEATGAAIQQAVPGLKNRVQAIVGQQRGVDVATGLPSLLGRLSQAGVVSRETILLLVSQLVVLAIVALLLVGGVVAARRRREEVLFRERGARVLDLAAASLAEGLLLGVPSVIAAVIVAGVVSAWLVELTVGTVPGVPTGIDLGILPIAVASALVGALVLAAPSVRAGASLVGLRTAIGRRVGRTFGQRIGLDAILLTLGAIGVWQLRSYASAATSGTPDPAAGASRSVDPILVVAPALGLVAGTLVVTRLVPRIAELLERALDRPRGLIVALGGREAARRPQRSSRIALLVVLAAALGTLAAVHSATWLASQRDQAAYQVPADVRVTAGTDQAIPAWLATHAYGSLPGVESASAVLDRTVLSGPAAGARLLAVDSAWMEQLATRPGASPRLAELRPSLAALTTGLPTDPGFALPPGTRRIRVLVDSDLRVFTFGDQGQPEPTDLPALGADVGFVVRDASGRISRVAAGTAANHGPTTLVIDLTRAVGTTSVSPEPGMTVVGVDLAIPAPSFTMVSGRVEITGIGASPDASGDTSWSDITAPLATGAWTWTRLEAASSFAYQPNAGAWGRIVLGSKPGPPSADGPATGDVIPTRFVLRPPVATAVPVPVLADERLLASLDASVGDTIDGSMIGEGVRVVIVGSTELFPTLDPARSFFVVDRRWFELARFESGGDPVTPDAWWLTARGGSVDPSLGQAVRAAPYSARDVVERNALQASLEHDPIALGTIGALALGAVAALLFSILGYVVHAATSTDDANRELGLLRALGASRRQVLAWLWTTHAALLAFSVAAGAVLGLLLAWLIVPTATVTASGRAPIPPPVLVLPSELGLGLVGVAVVLLALTLPIVAGLANRFDLATTLRTDAG